MLERVLTVYRKELLDVLRDLKALLPVLLFAAVLGPLTVTLTPRLVEIQVRQAVEARLIVGMAGDLGALADKLSKDANLVLKKVDPEDRARLLQSGDCQVVIFPTGDFAERLASYSGGEKIARGKPPSLQVYYTGLHPLSFFAMSRVSKVLTDAREALYERRLTALKIPIEASPDLEVKMVGPPLNGPFASRFVSTTLSSILFFVAFLGAVYPALDLLTGERERHTLESLILTPVESREIFTGKLLCVVTLSFSAVVLSVVSFYISQFFQPPLPDNMPFPLVCRLPALGAFLSVVLMFPVCFIIAASVMALAGMARTIQQAQGYLTSLVLILVTPFALSVFHLTPALACIPLIGIIISIDDILQARYAPGLMLLAVASTLAFVALVVAVVAPVMQREDLLWGSEEAPERRFAEGKFGLELFLLSAVTFLLMFYLSQTLVLEHHIWGLLATQILVVLLPSCAMVMFWLKLSPRQIFALRKPRGGFLTLISALLISPLTVSGALALASLQSRFFPDTASFEKLMEQILGLGKEPVWLLVLVIALSPAICEEFLFRGAVYSFLQKRFRPARLILVVGAMFGAFHMSTIRFLPTTLAGILITFVRYRSDSIFPCMVLHFAHNALSVLLASHLKKNPEPLYLVAAFILGLAGLALFVYVTRTAREVE